MNFLRQKSKEHHTHFIFPTHAPTQPHNPCNLEDLLLLTL